MVSSIADRLSPEYLDVIECGLFTSWHQHGPVHRGFLPFGNINSIINYNGVVTVKKIEEGIELTHKVDGVYNGIWPLEAKSDFLTEDNRSEIIYTDDFNGYQISDARPGEFILLKDELQVPHTLDRDESGFAVSYAAMRLCEKLGLRVDQLLAN